MVFVKKYNLDINEIKPLYESGISCDKLAEQFRVSRKTISRLLIKHNVEMRKPGMLKRNQCYQWKGGKRTFRKIVAEDLGIDIKQCSICGSMDYVCVHHKDKDKTNNTPENIEILCNSCHVRLHNKNKDVGWSMYNRDIKWKR